ncbi:MAG: hypothetical protein LBQ34_00465 [Alphaproteobacteria bacterium]|jgi:hypothetical protein|nr:hypothetical protein [Alphaproteobacteria bacterium]
MLTALKNIKKNLTSNVIGVINITDVRTFCLIYRVYENEEPKLLSIESTWTRGFEKGAVVDLNKALDCLSVVLQLAEKAAHTRILEVIVSAPLDKTATLNYPFMKTFKREITPEDIEELKDSNTYASTLNNNEIIISVCHNDIFLDGKKVENPEGMYADKLSADITIVKCFEPYIINLLNLFEHLSVNLVSIVHTPTALPYFLDVESPNAAMFVNIDANTTNISIANTSKVYVKEIKGGINNILSQALKNVGVSGNVLSEKEIYDIYFHRIKDKTLRFNFAAKEVDVSVAAINNELNKVITSFFELIMLECKHINMNNVVNISIIGECSNLLKLNTRFEEQMNANLQLINKLQDEDIILHKPLESVAPLSIMKYYTKNKTAAKTQKVLAKKLKDLLY